MSKLVEDIFIALDSMDKLRNTDNDSHYISFSTLFRYAHDPYFQVPEYFQSALRRDPKAQRDLKRLLGKNSLVILPFAAAASSGEILQREADGFEIQLKSSQASDKQIYLIIRSEYRDEIPKMLFVTEEGGNTLRHILEDYENGHSQSILDITSPLVKALKNHASLVILRT